MLVAKSLQLWCENEQLLSKVLTPFFGREDGC